MIKIGKPYTFSSGGRAYLKADIRISQDTVDSYKRMPERSEYCVWLTGTDYPPSAWQAKNAGLWFSVQEKYEEYLCTQRSNSFVMAMFWYAMITESDICFETPMSARLYHGLVDGIMPAMEKNGRKPIRLIGPLSEETVLRCPGIVSGMSCGVDSMYTLKNYYKNAHDKKDRLDYLAYYDVNPLLSICDEPNNPDIVYEMERKCSIHIVKAAASIAANNDIPFVHVLSNIDCDYYRGGALYTAMYRYMACTLALEPMYHRYVIASSGHGKDIKADLLVPSQHYEELFCECCQTESLQCVISDNILRVQKLRVLADDVDFQKHAAVCFNNRNCGECYGCWKTMFPLDIMGKLGGFSESFNLEKYYKSRPEAFRDFIMYSMRPEADSARESLKQILKLAKEENTEAAREFLNVYNDVYRTESRAETCCRLESY